MTIKYFALVLALCLGFTGIGAAATITFSAANFTNANQLNTNGSLVEAINFGNTTPVANVVVNGIAFVSVDTTSANLSPTAPFGASTHSSNYRHGLNSPAGRNPIGITDTEANRLLDSIVASTNAAPTPTDNNVITLSGLTNGNDYVFQLLLVDDRTDGNVPGRTVTVDEIPSGTNTTGALDNTSNFIQLVTGLFTADAAMQQFRIRQTGTGGTNASRLNAYQLRNITPVPEPSAISLALVGLFSLGLLVRHRYGTR